MNRVNALFVLGALLAGCGGSHSGGTSYHYALTPDRATVPAGGTATFTIAVDDPRFYSVAYFVFEGALGGTVDVATSVEGAVYTAPGSAGTYHVQARFFDGQLKELATRTATVTVTATAQ